MKYFLGLTWVGWFNFIILQWFFVRLFYTINDDDTLGDFGLMFFVFPLSGWWWSYNPKIMFGKIKEKK